MLVRFSLFGVVTGAVLALLAVLIGHALPTEEIAYDRSVVPAHIYLLDVNRALSTRLSYANTLDQSPAWSPTGRQIASLGLDPGVQYIVIRDMETGESHSVYISPAVGRLGPSLVWSPDGSRLAFTTERANSRSIYLLDLSVCTPEQSASDSLQPGGPDTCLRQITASGASAFSPTFSPDGQSLAFSWSPVANQEVYIADLADHAEPISRTNGLLRLTDTPALDTDPAWSPDGRSIAFVTDRDDNSEIYLISPDGSNLRRLTHRPTRDVTPTWLPDGRLLFFSEGPSGRSAYIVEPDCADCQPIPLNLPIDYFPGMRMAWRPSPP